MTIFDHLYSILFTKKGDNLKNVDDESTFLPFMVNRWVSMHSPAMAKIINDTTNRYSKHFDLFSKREYNAYYHSTLPQCRFKRIAYIKKSKKETDEDEDKKVELIAKSQELSQREIRELVEFNKTICK